MPRLIGIVVVDPGACASGWHAWIRGLAMKSFFPLLAACLLSLYAQAASASMREVRAGDAPELRADEGLLVVAVDSSDYIGTLSITRQGKVFGGESISDIKQGKTAKLFAVTAGDYRWDSIRYDFARSRFYLNLKDDEALHFTVKPGAINYPGDLVYRPEGTARAHISTLNHGLEAMDWLQANHPLLYAKYPFAFSGHVPDPFPEFYRTALAAQPGRTIAELDKTLPPPDPGKLPIDVADLWRDQRVQAINLDHSGRLLAEAIHENDAWHVDLIDLKQNESVRLMNAAAPVARLDWIGDHVLGVLLESDIVSTVYVVHIGADGKKAVGFPIPRAGHIVDPLPGDPDHILFESTGEQGDQRVFRLDVSSESAFDRNQFNHDTLVSRGIPDARSWLSDGNGNLRAAIARQGDKMMLFYGADGSYAPVLDVGAEDAFEPLAMSADGKLFYGLSDKDRAQTDLVAFDPVSRSITSTMFSKPGVDVDDAVFDAHQNLIGAAYFEDGKRVVEYFDNDDRNIRKLVAAAFPGLSTALIDRDDSGKQLILSAEGSDQPARIYQLNLADGVASLLEDNAPWLADKHLAPARTLHVNGSDGLPIEAYLTMPVNQAGKAPLIVYTHGGPIGIRDTVDFDPAVQLFASLGYAVLQVNYRGSDGYGRAFREAGRHHFGSLIEDDIDAATRAVLQQFPVDAERICAVGASYGGYSALVQAIRWPQRFRCAVSIAGVSDQMLMFSASDSSYSANDRKRMAELIGDPATDAATMRAYSPLYRYKEIAVPVMLAHGTDDRRVDYEHSRRLVRMLNLAGRPPVMISFEGEGHGDFNTKDETALWNAVAGFLREHLDAKPNAAARESAKEDTATKGVARPEEAKQTPAPAH